MSTPAAAPPGYTPAPTEPEPDPSPPVHLLCAVAPWTAWGFKFDHSEAESAKMIKDESSGMSKLVHAKKNILLHDHSSEYRTSKHFEYEAGSKVHSCITKFKDNSKQINYLDLKTFLEHPLVEPIVTNPQLCASITYVRTFEGREEIDEATAFNDSKAENYDPSKKPVSRPRPGKRAAPAASSSTSTSADPATEQTSRDASAKRAAR